MSSWGKLNMEGPATNLRQTPGRLAANIQQTKEVEEFYTKCTNKTVGKKRSKQKRSGGKDSAKKASKSTGKVKTKGKKPLPTSTGKQQKLDRYFNENRTEPSNEENFYKLTVAARIKQLEKGYLTDPEIEIRKEKIANSSQCGISSLTTERNKSHAEHLVVQTHKRALFPDKVNDYKLGVAPIDSLKPAVFNQATNCYVHCESPTINRRLCNNDEDSRLYNNRRETNIINVDTYNKFDVLRGFDTCSSEEMQSDCLVTDCNYQTGQMIDDHRWHDYVNNRRYLSATTNTSATVTNTSPRMNTATTMTSMYTSAAFSSVVQPTAGAYSQSQYQMPLTSTLAFPPLGTHLRQNVVPVNNTTVAAANSTPGIRMPVNPPQDLVPVYQMLAQISAKIDAGNTSTELLRTEVQAFNNRIETVENDLGEQEDLLYTTVDKVNKSASKMNLITSATVKHEKEIAEINKRLDAMDLVADRNKMVVTGIVEKKEENCQQLVADFIKTELEMDTVLEIQKAYRIGQGENRPILFELVDYADKYKIFSFTKNLKLKVNSAGKPYQVREQLPEKYKEVDQRQRYLVRQNKRRKNTVQHLNMSFKRKQLMINNQVYKKKAPAPNFADVLTMDEEERIKIQTATVVEEKEFRERENTFKSYACNVTTPAEVRAVHKHLKIKHADATVIPVAYNIAGVMPDLQDYDDDGEIGCGTRMLEVLQQKEAVNTAVYLVRYHSKQNLGVRRFEIFKEMTEKVIDKLQNGDNLFTSRIPTPKSAVKQNKFRTRGRHLGPRGSSHSHRGRLHMDEEIPCTTDTDPEVVIQARKKDN